MRGFIVSHDGNIGLLSAIQGDSSVALFEFLGTLPLSGVMSLLATILVILFL
jgi:choline/glycine/proline betaine transport protein